MCLLGVIYAIVPVYADDMWYSQRTFGIDSAVERMCIIADNCVNHWCYDTGRLCNLFAPLFLGLFPKYVFAICSAVVAWFYFKYTLKLTGSSMGGFVSWALLFVYVFLMPWGDLLTAVIYALNYQWAGAFAIVAFCLYVKNFRSPQPYTQWQFVLVALVCISAGWMHEGFSLPIMCGIFVHVWLNKFKINSTARAIALYILLGMVLTFLSPSLYYKPKIYEPTDIQTLVYQFVRFNTFMLTLIAMVVVAMCVKPLRKRFTDNKENMSVVLSIIVMALVASVIYVRFRHGTRMFWFPQQFSFVGVVVMTKTLFPTLRLRKLRNVAAVVVSVLTIADLSYNAHVQRLYTAEFNIVMQLYLQSKDGVVYYDVMPEPRYLSLIEKTSFEQYYKMTQFQCPQYYFGDFSKAKPLVVRPTTAQN
jgi:hypothetical protein